MMELHAFLFAVCWMFPVVLAGQLLLGAIVGVVVLASWLIRRRGRLHV